MKKIIAIALIAVLMFSCVGALAANEFTDITLAGADNMTVSVSGGGDPANNAQFLVDPVLPNKATSAKQKTALWLKVAAEGQIDCTIPLALVYKTNIDGGSATTSGTYKIINNSSAQLDVINIKVHVNAVAAKTNPMSMVNVGALDSSKYNEYTATMTAGSLTAQDLHDATWISNAGYTKGANLGGIFSIPKKGTNPGETAVAVTVTTGKLDFVTGNDTAGAIATHGVHLLDIEYTVAIDQKGAQGEDVTGTVNGHVYSGDTPGEYVYTYANTGAVTSTAK